MHADAFPFLSRVHRLTDGVRTTTPELRDAVAVLTAAADPERAERLRPLPGEPAVLVARLAVHALRTVGPEAIADATAVLDGPGADAPSGTAAHVRHTRPRVAAATPVRPRTRRPAAA